MFMRLASVMAAVLLAWGILSPGPTDATEVFLKRVEMIMEGGSALDRFRRPIALTADVTRGVIIVADAGGRRLVTFDRHFRSRGSIVFDADRATEPRGLAVDSRGRIFLADALAGEIEVMDSRGTHITSFMPDLPLEGEAAHPEDIAIGASGNIYVLAGGRRPGICVMDSDGNVVRTLGFQEPGQGLFTAPVSMSVSADERRIAVVDPTAERSVLVLAADGTLETGFGTHGEGEGTFSMASDVVWGPGGSLWVTDTLRHSIGVFDDRGNALGRIGGYGSGPGQFKYPVDCVFLADDRIVVLERATARFQVLEVEAIPPLRADESLEVSGSGAAGAASTTR